MVETAQKVLTYDEWLALPESMTRQEVIDGVVHVSPTPTSDHQWLNKNISSELDVHVRARGLGVVLYAPLDIVISREPLRTRRPDVLFLSAERSGVFGRKQLRSMPIINIAPDLVVEIMSPSGRRRDLLEKLGDYARIDVLECWIISPEAETVEVLRLSGEGWVRVGLFGIGETIRSGVLPDLDFLSTRSSRRHRPSRALSVRAAHASRDTKDVRRARDPRNLERPSPVDPDDRIALIDRAFQRFLARAEDDDYIVVGVAGNPDCYVQFTIDGGELAAEIGSRERPAPSSLFGPFAGGFLELHEFTRPDDRANYRRDNLPPEPWTLALMTERLLGIYELGDNFDVEIRGKSGTSTREARDPNPWYTPRLDDAWRRDRERRERRRKRRQSDDARWR
mgnify:CR=1 FL=1